jgi:hypothetical protein
MTDTLCSIWTRQCRQSEDFSPAQSHAFENSPQVHKGPLSAHSSQKPGNSNYWPHPERSEVVAFAVIRQ